MSRTTSSKNTGVSTESTKIPTPTWIPSAEHAPTPAHPRTPAHLLDINNPGHILEKKKSEKI